QFATQRPAKLLYPGLGHRIRRHQHAVDEGVDRRDDHDVSAVGDDVRKGGMHGAVDTEQVDVEHALEFGGVHRASGRWFGCDAGIGHHDIEAAQTSNHLVYGAH